MRQGLSLLVVLSARPLAARPLHIVHITADDLGWNDLGFAQAAPAVSLTPAIDAAVGVPMCELCCRNPPAAAAERAEPSLGAPRPAGAPLATP